MVDSTKLSSLADSAAAALPSLDPRSAHKAARRLGWFGIAVGAVQLLMPELVARATGMRGGKMLLRLAGMREIGVGAGLLVANDPAPWLWARVGGDALDAATLAVQLRSGNSAAKTAVALAAVAGLATLDLACARALDAAEPAPARDYSRRRGLPLPPDEMRGIALEDFVLPRDMQIPHPLAPYRERW